MHDEMADDMIDEIECEKKRLHDPEEALPLFVEAVKQVNEHKTGREKLMPLPVKIVRVLDVVLHFGMRSRTVIRARALRSDSVEDTIELTAEAFHGGREEPPSSEEIVFWENLDDDNEPIDWRLIFTLAVDGEEMDDSARRRKGKFLHELLCKNGVRARIENDRLEVNVNEYKHAYTVMGQFLMNLPSHHDVFKTSPR